jgi:uncharacterized protein (TIGR02118 family)
MARMVVIYKTPKDPVAFDKHYFEIHIPLAKTLPGLIKYEVSRGPIKSLSSNPSPHLVGTLYFEDMAAINTAFASPEGQACAADRRIFAPNADDFQMYLFDSREM